MTTLSADMTPQNSPFGVMAIDVNLKPVAMINVPETAKIIHSVSLKRGRRFFVIHTKSIINSGERYCSTVAVPALEFAIADRYANWQNIRPQTENMI